MAFIMASLPGEVVTARLITSPGHMKRMLKALQNNVKEYEKEFGKIEMAKEPELISFKPE